MKLVDGKLAEVVGIRAEGKPPPPPLFPGPFVEGVSGKSSKFCSSDAKADSLNESPFLKEKEK